MKALWQRAVITRAVEERNVGRKLWVRVEKPQIQDLRGAITGQRFNKVRCVTNNILDKHGRFCQVSIDDIELLGGEENFSTDVRPITIEMWEYTHEGVDL